MACFIDPLKIQKCIRKSYCIHSASDIHAHNVGTDLVRYCHGGSYRTSFSCMNVRHDSDPASFRQGIITHSADLLNCPRLCRSGIADGGIFLSLYLKHRIILSKQLPEASGRSKGITPTVRHSLFLIAVWRIYDRMLPHLLFTVLFSLPGMTYSRKKCEQLLSAAFLVCQSLFYQVNKMLRSGNPEHRSK